MPTDSTDRETLVAGGRAAYARRAWAEAHASLAAADAAEALGPDDLWLLAQSAYLTGGRGTFMDTVERLHHAHLEVGATVAAARDAFWLGFWLANEGDMARAGGWLGRAGRLLDGVQGDCAERGYLLVPAAYRQLLSGDWGAAFETAAGAVAAGERFDDPDLLCLAVHLQGRALVLSGQVEEGLALLDEAMVAMATDRLSPPVAGLVYCSAIGACRSVWALRRAHAWTAALSDWCAQQPDLVPYSGECLVYRAEILQLRGEWGEAMEEAGRARERLDRGGDRTAVAGARYRQAEVHRLRGELAAAEDAFAEVRSLGMEPQPGLALLRLAQGDGEAAAAALRRVLAETPHPQRRARLLPAHVEILLATGDVEEARRACEEIESLADEAGTDALGTLAAQARGAVTLAADDAAAALSPLRRALDGWGAMEAPYEAARVRVLLGLACRALGDADTAALELAAARAAFHRLGAGADAARVDALAREDVAPSPPTAGSHGLTPREREVLALVATGRTNRAIALVLFISERTVARHVSNVFAKLGLSSRAAATAYAYEHDLLGPRTQN